MKKINVKAALLKTAGATAGALVAKQADKLPIPASFPKWALPAIKVIAGAFLPSIAKAKPGSPIDAAGTVMMGVGGQELVGAFVPSLAGLPSMGSVQFDEKYENGTMGAFPTVNGGNDYTV